MDEAVVWHDLTGGDIKTNTQEFRRLQQPFCEMVDKYEWVLYYHQSTQREILELPEGNWLLSILGTLNHVIRRGCLFFLLAAKTLRATGFSNFSVTKNHQEMVTNARFPLVHALGSSRPTRLHPATPSQDSESFQEILTWGGGVPRPLWRSQDRLCGLVHTDTTIQQGPCVWIIFSFPILCFCLNH